MIGTVNSIVRRGLVTPLFEEEEGLTIEVGERLLLAGEVDKCGIEERQIHVRSGER